MSNFKLNFIAFFSLLTYFLLLMNTCEQVKINKQISNCIQQIDFCKK